MIRVLLELEPQYHLMANCVGPGCQQQPPFVHWVFLLSTWACWKQTVFQRMSIANKPGVIWLINIHSGPIRAET